MSDKPFDSKASPPDAEALCQQLAEAIRPHLTEDTGFIGIHTGGVWVAERVRQMLGITSPMGVIDVTFYRDDFSRTGLHPQIRRSDIPFAVKDRPIIVVDDVLYTGRTVRAAMNEIFDYGRPSRIDLAVLADRGGRELPVAATWCPLHIELPANANLQLLQDEAGALSLRVIDA